MSILDGPLVIVDVETTGMNYSHGRIIEIGAIRLENSKRVASINTLINPETPINPFIRDITGIEPNSLGKAPVFSDIAEQLADIMDGALFVAHNVRFDYSFIKNEYKRLGKDFKPKMLCSVRLSKSLYPHYRGHSLQKIIDRHSIKVKSRHRAYDDAKAVWDFINIARLENSVEAVEAAVRQQIKRPALPAGITQKQVNLLPQGHGVYIFEDEAGSPLYIGKSVNIRNRVLSHFSSDHSSSKEMKIGQQITNITTHQTNGELESLLLEAQLIKQLQPLYNRKLRRLQKLTIAQMEYDENGYIRISLNEANPDSLDPGSLGDILGVYSTRGQARQVLESYIKIYDICPKLMGLEKGQGSCFSYQLKKCGGACIQKVTPQKHNFKVTTAFATTRMRSWPYQGPVLIEENSIDTKGTSAIVVDQWCVVAQLNEQDSSDAIIKPLEKRFDLDTYKILQSYLSRKSHSLRIKPITSQQLNSILVTI